jgi:hypothetical protein
MQAVARCTICDEMFPWSLFRFTCWKHNIDSFAALPQGNDDDTQPGIVPTYQLDGSYLKTLKGL